METVRRAMLAGRPIGVASVVLAYRSSPRPVGASMLLDADGRVHGSVSGGCVEAAVFDSLNDVLGGGRPRVERYGISDGDAFAVGLTCGGVIHVLIDVLTPDDRAAVEQIDRAMGSGQAIATITLLDEYRAARSPHRTMAGRAVVGTGDVLLSAPWLTPSAVERARERLASGSGGIIDVDEVDGRVGRRAFVDVWRPRPRLMVFGSTQVAAELARLGKGLDHDVTVCDARETFTTSARFPDADEVVVDWPHRYLRAESEAGRTNGDTVVAVLTHDAKFEIPLLRFLLAECPSQAAPGFIGVMGSRRSHLDRRARLLDAGVSVEQQSALASPFGLDLGGATPAETGLSMAAEIVAWRYGGTGRRLRTTTGDIHRSASLP